MNSTPSVCPGRQPATPRLRPTSNLIDALVVLGALIPIGGLGLPLVVVLAGGFAAAAAVYSTTRTDRPSAALA